MSAASLVVGIGSPFGDDRVGWEIVDRLAAIAPADIAVRRAQTPADLLDWLEGIERLEICDAVSSASDAGSVACWTWPAAEIERAAFHSSHDLSLPAVLALAETLGTLPAHVRIWGVAIDDACPHESLSSVVAAAVPQVVERIRAALRQ